MMLWSVVPSEFVFHEPSMDIPESRMCMLADVPLMVVESGDGLIRIERVLSSNPSHYLRPELQPGSRIPSSSVVFS